MKLREFLDYVFPRFCLECGSFGQYACDNCLAQIVLLEHQSCPHCRKISGLGLFCDDCSKLKYHFDQLIVCLEYGYQALAKKLIAVFKYKFAKDLVEFFGSLMSGQYSRVFDGPDYESFLVVPVPLHDKRLRFRGFNQAALLASALVEGAEDSMIYFDCLRRNEYRTEQAKLSKEDRLDNLKDTFALEKDFEGMLEGKFVLLIDDIATTCSTLNECSRVLKLAGAEYICCLTLARARLYC